MKEKTNKIKRSKLINESMLLIISSLESHLPYTGGGRMIRNETNKFHVKAVQEYAKVIYNLSQLY